MGCCMPKAPGPKTPSEFKDQLAKYPEKDSSVYWLLQQSAANVKADKDCVMAAVEKNGLALDVAADKWKVDPEIVAAAVENDGDAFSYVPKKGVIWEDKNFVKPLVEKQGFALQYAPKLNADKDVVLAAVSNKGSAIQYADAKLKGDKDVALAAVKQERAACLHIDKTAEMWKDPDFVLEIVELEPDTLTHVDKNANFWKDQSRVLSMVKLQGNALQFADKNLKEDREVVEAAIKQKGDALEFVDKKASFWSHKKFVLSLVNETGRALEFASDDIKKDTEVVLAAVKSTPTSLKFAQKALQDDEKLKKASGVSRFCPYNGPVVLTGDDQQTSEQKKQVSLSVKFVVANAFTDYAANFAVMLKNTENKYLLDTFKIYGPSMWRQSSCDPEYKNVDKPCLGTNNNTCQLHAKPPAPDPVAKTSTLGSAAQSSAPEQTRPSTTSTRGSRSSTVAPRLSQKKIPASTEMQPKPSCGRFDFRKQLEKTKATNGFMIQVQEKHGLGDGQLIETKMAQDTKVKIFRTIATTEDVKKKHLEDLEKKIKEWYDSGCRNKYMEEILLK